MNRARLLSAFAAPLFLALSASPVIAYAAPPIDFEAGFSKGMTVDNQFAQSHGVQFSVVDIISQAVTYPVIGETYDTDPGCGLSGVPGSDAGCGPGTPDGWVYLNGITPVQGVTPVYFDRLSTAIEPLSKKTHKDLVGRYFLAYPKGTDSTKVYLRVLYMNPTQKLSFGIIDIDGNEQWTIEARDANDVVLATKQVDGDPNNIFAGDGEVRFIDIDVSAGGGLIKELRVQYTAGGTPGLGFDVFSTTDIPSFGCGDGKLDPSEGCDDGNTMSGDGCSQDCQPEQGYTCTGEPSKCASTCGDGVVASDEACDDGNKVSGDGCSDGCKTETASSSSSSSSSGSSSSSSSSGSSGAGGGGSGGGGGGGGTPDPGDSGGCSCQVHGGAGGERGLGVIALAAMALLRRRRTICVTTR